MAERRVGEWFDWKPEAIPGRGAHLCEEAGAWPTAAPRLERLDEVERRAGPAWSDPAFRRELVALHERAGAGPDTFAAMESLAQGAACVITGQQPGLLAGPLYCAWKIAGAIALAAELTRRQGRPVIPVYWCGSDDSDFDEVRRVWAWGGEDRFFRGEWPRDLWRAGQRVGSVRGDALARIETNLMRQSGIEHSRLRPVPADLDLGERMAAWVLQLFAGRGLVVVDARSPSLLARGRALFRRYAANHRACARSLRERAEALRARGWSPAFDARAIESGLFVLEGERRVKLGSEQLDALDDSSVVAPSVLLRALWQDEQLAPLAAVLGPGEVRYHAQLAPLYEHLEVGASRPVSRPHLWLWPRDVPSPPPTVDQSDLLESGSGYRRWLADRALPGEWSHALLRSRERLEAALRELAVALDDPELRASVERFDREVQAQWDRLRTRAIAPALARQGGAWTWSTEFLFVRGALQERALTALTAAQWWGEDFDVALDALGERYVAAVHEGRTPAWIVRGGER